MMYVLHGPDAFLVRSELRRLREEHDPGELNTSLLDARSARVDEIIAALGTPGFFGPGRVIVVTDLLGQGTRGSQSGDEDGESKRSKLATNWTVLFGAVEPGNVAIFVDAEIGSLPAAVKKALPPDATVFAGVSPRGGELISWIKERAKRAGSSIADADARYLADTLCPKTWAAKPSNPAYDRPPDLELFAGEIDKLALATDGPITRATIDEMTAAAQPDSLFPLIDAFVASDGPGMLRELRHASDGGEELSRISAQLIQQVELMAAQAAAGARMDPADLGRALGLSNPNRMFAVRKSLDRLRMRPEALVAAAVECERAFKSGVIRQPADQIYALFETALASSRVTRRGGA